MLDRSNVITACLRFHKASKDHRAAQLLLEHGYYEAANDRAFFCMLHSARALMAYISLNDAMNDYTPTDVVIENFRDNYILQRYHDPRLYEMFETVRKNRKDETYSRDFMATKEGTEQNVQNAGYFLETAKAISNRRLALNADSKTSFPIG